MENSSGDELYRLLVAAVRDYAIFALDPNGNILTWNAGAKHLKGYEAEEVIGSHFSRFYTPEDIQRDHPAFELKEAIKNGAYEEEGWRVRKDGSRMWANVLITTLKNNNGSLRGFAKVTRDLTERKISEEKLREANERLEERVKERTIELGIAKDAAEAAVKVRDEFLSIASHELKTPLTSLSLQIQMRKRAAYKGRYNPLRPEQFISMLEDDEKQLNRIAILVEDMLDITRISGGKLILQRTEVDLGHLVRDVHTRFIPQLELLEIEIDLAIDESVIGFWDHYRIEQVFINLLTNAIKYGGGQPISVVVSQKNGTAILSVQDHGIGIAPEDQARVFRQFERAISASSISGLGLGLYIATEIVNSHQGSISLTSELGKGSTFVVGLPVR